MSPFRLHTPRLTLRRFTPDDAPFIVELLNEPGWLRFIGDKQIHDLDAARRYLENGPIAMYGTHGFGLLMVESRDDGTPLGMCGLIKRPSLDDVDLGFAFLERHQGRGYASEAGAEVLRHAREDHRLSRVVAITDQDNHASGAVLVKLGLRHEKNLQLGADDAPVRLFSTR